MHNHASAHADTAAESYLRSGITAYKCDRDAGKLVTSAQLAMAADGCDDAPLARVAIESNHAGNGIVLELDYSVFGEPRHVTRHIEHRRHA